LIALLGKNAEVAEIGRTELELGAINLNGPGLGQLVAAAPLIASLAEESGGHFLPVSLGEGLLPDRLRTGPGEHDAAKALQFLK